MTDLDIIKECNDLIYNIQNLLKMDFLSERKRIEIALKLIDEKLEIINTLK